MQDIKILQYGDFWATKRPLEAVLFYAPQETIYTEIRPTPHMAGTRATSAKIGKSNVSSLQIREPYVYFVILAQIKLYISITLISYDTVLLNPFINVIHKLYLEYITNAYTE